MITYSQLRSREAAVELSDTKRKSLGLDNGAAEIEQIRRCIWVLGWWVAVTGWGNEDDKRLSVRAGFDLHFTMPISFEQVEFVLARL